MLLHPTPEQQQVLEQQWDLSHRHSNLTGRAEHVVVRRNSGGRYVIRGRQVGDYAPFLPWALLNEGRQSWQPAELVGVFTLAATDTLQPNALGVRPPHELLHTSVLSWLPFSATDQHLQPNLV